ncbi:heterokaryon incompatibility protein-domain-containing protein [Corynascus novoguineensis]|uniref:Heterokaryon incompatibility protein-domain-containing protein n=1 Tax=Corynascus novoguineensis TaxID=1126955 RepID=A0AAN7CUR8_9PEZI|nr:heterokaryon incompatibility protein-domain-containing protein [Corynascus novoguineensis]
MSGYYSNQMPASAGDPNCGLCCAQWHERWSSLAEIQAHAADGCPYCANMVEGLLHLVPDVGTRYGEDAQFRFKNRREMIVYADPNGSLRNTKRPEDIRFEYRWYMVDEPQPYEPVGNTSAEGSFAVAQDWLRDCLDNHKLCGNGEPTALPTRVLDLGEEGEETSSNDDDGGEKKKKEEEEEEEAGDDGEKALPQVIRLVESTPGQTGRYICLSHSWGGEQPLTTTTTNLDEHKTVGIQVDGLPATFRDACDIARRLGIRYLWIDSLCIVQDNPSDWEAEASRMASVYRNSWLTVYAAASSSPSSGIYRRRQAVWIAADDPDDAETLDLLFPQAAELRRNLRLSLRFAFCHPDFAPYANPTRQKTALPLLARAWAYQERLLAPRVLHFGPHELLWECTQKLDCDCGGVEEALAPPRHMGTYASRDTTAQLPPKVSHYAALHLGGGGRGTNNTGGSKIAETKRRKKLLARWEEMVQEYTHRALTFSGDRLPAFSGVAAEMVEALHGTLRYCAGQWAETLPEALLYERTMTTDPAKLPIVTAAIATTDDNSRPAPSWSWASVDDAVRFLVPLAGSPDWADPVVHAKVLEVRCVPAGADERGRVRRAESHVTLSTELVRADLCFVADNPYLVPGKSWAPIRDAVVMKKGPQAALKQLGPGSFGVWDRDQEALHFLPDVQLCDEHGEWLWDGKDEIACARIMEANETAYWLVLRRLEAGSDGPVYERIGVVQDRERVLPSTDEKTSFKLI